MELLRFAAWQLSPALTSASRPGLTFCAIQWLVAIGVRMDLVVLAPELVWLVSVPALVIAGALGGLETLARHDPSAGELLDELHLSHLTGAFGAFSSALLFTGLGLPEAAVAPDGDLATAVAAGASHSTPVQAAAIAGAVAINVGLTSLRAEWMEFLRELELASLWSKFETGGVLAVLLLLPLLPVVALLLVVMASIALAVAGWMARLATRAWDARCRVPCGACGYLARQEASVCPECDAAMVPQKVLGVSVEGRWRAAWAMLRARGAPAV